MAKNHWILWTKSMKPTDDFPKVVWYGEATLSQRYFLLLLMELGCDVLIFHPTKIDELAEIDPNDTFSITYAYTNQTTLQPFLISCVTGRQRSDIVLVSILNN